MLKKLLLASLIVLAMLFCFVACDDNSSSKKPSFNAKATPLTLENTGRDSLIVTIAISGFGPDEAKMKYSIDGGEMQEIPSTGTPYIEVEAGKTISFYGDRAENASSQAKTISIACSSACYVYGNVMSLITSTDFESNTSLENYAYAFTGLFKNNTKLKLHESKELVLPAQTLAPHCYAEMFYGCEGLNKAPELPATTLAEACYSFMFYGCRKLIKAPKLPAMNLAEQCYSAMFSYCEELKEAPELPATTLASLCYQVMFSSCSNLTKAPELPATTLAERCYEGMFSNCTGLTSTPSLPANTLARLCYSYMFFGCTSLTKAPELPATTLVERCYEGMFSGCANLASVTCLAKTTAQDATQTWLSTVAPTGSFTRPADADFWTTDANGIPSGWTVIDAE